MVEFDIRSKRLKMALSIKPMVEPFPVSVLVVLIWERGCAQPGNGGRAETVRGCPDNSAMTLAILTVNTNESTQA